MVETESATSLLEEVNERLRGMEERIGRLELRIAETAVKPVASAPAPAPVRVEAAPKKEDEQIEPEVLMVIAAAVAAFMGKKARIRRVRRSVAGGMNPWAQQGRVSIQASHNVGWTR
jgi:methylmalonyl-CoA carboxyltransferase large subunit